MGTTAAAIALAAMGLGLAYGKVEKSSLHQKLYGWAAAVVLVIAGAYAIIHLSRAIGRLVTRQSNPGSRGDHPTGHERPRLRLLDHRASRRPWSLARSPLNRRGCRGHHSWCGRPAEPRQRLRGDRHAVCPTVRGRRHDSHPLGCHGGLRRQGPRHRPDLRDGDDRRRSFAHSQLDHARRGNRTSEAGRDAGAVTRAVDPARRRHAAFE